MLNKVILGLLVVGAFVLVGCASEDTSSAKAPDSSKVGTAGAKSAGDAGAAKPEAGGKPSAE